MSVEVSMMFFDAWTQIGARPNKHHAERWSLRHLTDEMQHCSISGALVSHTQSINYDPMHGNLVLSEELKSKPHLWAIWNVMPHFTGECPPPTRLIEMMRAHDAKAVSIHPKTNGWDYLAERNTPLFEKLGSERIPVFLPREEMGDYRALTEFLNRNPFLPIVLTGVAWNDQRFLLPLLQEHENLHVTFERFQINWGLEDLVEMGLENQLLFASQAPLRSMGAHRTYIDYAILPAAVRRKIAGGNLRRLLGGCGPEFPYGNPEEDTIMRAARQGEPIPHIDLHMHILHEGLNGAGGSYRMHKGGPRGVFAMLDRLGCLGGGFMSWNGTVSADTMAGNACTAEALDAAPAGYWGLASFDPLHYSLEEFRNQIAKLYQCDHRFIGMKPYWIQGLDYTDARYAEWWKYGNEHHFYALIHRVRADFAEVDFLAEHYPDVRWVVAHCAADFQTADMAIACARRHPNVFLEITLTPTYLGVIDYLVEGAGDDRVVYGSDLPMRDPRQQFGWVLYSRLSEYQKRRVLLENARAVIEPCLSRLPEYNRPRAAGDEADVPRELPEVVAGVLL